jgi:putative DNA primase/helicase
MTYGDANTGKTFVDLDIALHLAYGMCWQGRKLAQTRVLYIYGEGNEGLANRIDAWQRKHGKEDTDAIQFICFPVQLMTEMEILCATIEEQETIPGLIVLDTFSVCAEGVPENDNVEVARFISCASKIKRTYKTHVHIIHHAGKNGDYRGAAAFKGNVDTMALLCREDNEAPIIMVCKKQKDAFYFPDIRLQLEQVILGFDEETLESISSCVVVSSDELTFNEERVNQERQVMMNALAKSEKMSVKMWREACARENVSRNAFYAHKDYLVQTGRIVEEKLGPGKPVYYSAIKDEG